MLHTAYEMWKSSGLEYMLVYGSSVVAIKAVFLGRSSKYHPIWESTMDFCASFMVASFLAIFFGFVLVSNMAGMVGAFRESSHLLGPGCTGLLYWLATDMTLFVRAGVSVGSWCTDIHTLMASPHGSVRRTPPRALLARSGKTY